MPAYPASELVTETLSDLLADTEGVADVADAHDAGWLVPDDRTRLLVTLDDGTQLLLAVSEVQL